MRPIATSASELLYLILAALCSLPDIVQCILMNIIGNAIKYTPDGGHIRVTAGATEDMVWMDVQDDGIGIPEKDLGHIFERFYRSDKARTGDGHGLGLSIAKTIVEAHAGEITVTSDEARGTVMTVTFNN